MIGTPDRWESNLRVSSPYGDPQRRRGRSLGIGRRVGIANYQAFPFEDDGLRVVLRPDRESGERQSQDDRRHHGQRPGWSAHVQHREADSEAVLGAPQQRLSFHLSPRLHTPRHRSQQSQLPAARRGGGGPATSPSAPAVSVCLAQFQQFQQKVRLPPAALPPPNVCPLKSAWKYPSERVPDKISTSLCPVLHRPTNPLSASRRRREGGSPKVNYWWERERERDQEEIETFDVAMVLLIEILSPSSCPAGM